MIEVRRDRAKGRHCEIFGFLDDLFGDTGAPGEASAFAQQQNLAAEKRIESGLSSTIGRLDPFLQAGTDALPGVIQGTTAGGLDERIGDIAGTGSFQNLIAERQRALQGQLSAGGLTRSGTALQEASNLTQESLFDIEELLSGRLQGLTNLGQRTAVQQGGFEQGAATNIAQLRTSTGATGAEGILQSANARQQRDQAIFNTVTSFLF